MRLILIDDESNNLLVTKEIMSLYDSDIKIKTSSSPMEVLEWIKNDAPDCVISDYKMPEMNGIEFTRKLRETSKIPVILYSNQSKANVATEAFDAGVNDYIRKNSDPLHHILLLKKIKNAVDKYRLELQLLKNDETKNQNKKESY